MRQGSVGAWGWVLVAGAALAAGCGSTGIGNPGTGSATLSLTIVNDDDPEPGAADPETELAADQLRHAVLVFGQLRWLPCEATDEPVVVPGQIVVDLATGRVEPELADVTVPPAGFCGLEAPLAPARAPATLVGRSVFFSGLREDGTLFLLYGSVAGTLQVRARPGVTWGTQDEEHVSLLWAQRPRRWLTPGEIEDADAVPVGDIEDLDAIEDTQAIERVIPIDADRHPLLLELVRARLAGRSTLHLDTNSNARLDPAERDDEAWLGSGLPELD